MNSFYHLVFFTDLIFSVTDKKSYLSSPNIPLCFVLFQNFYRFKFNIQVYDRFSINFYNRVQGQDTKFLFLFIFWHMEIQFFQYHLLKRLSFLHFTDLYIILMAPGPGSFFVGRFLTTISIYLSRQQTIKIIYF